MVGVGAVVDMAVSAVIPGKDLPLDLTKQKFSQGYWGTYTGFSDKWAERWSYFIVLPMTWAQNKHRAKLVNLCWKHVNKCIKGQIQLVQTSLFLQSPVWNLAVPSALTENHKPWKNSPSHELHT